MEDYSDTLWEIDQHLRSSALKEMIPGPEMDAGDAHVVGIITKPYVQQLWRVVNFYRSDYENSEVHCATCKKRAIEMQDAIGGEYVGVEERRKLLNDEEYFSLCQEYEQLQREATLVKCKKELVARLLWIEVCDLHPAIIGKPRPFIAKDWKLCWKDIEAEVDALFDSAESGDCGLSPEK